jgi:hypothetical protein
MSGHFLLQGWPEYFFRVTQSIHQNQHKSLLACQQTNINKNTSTCLTARFDSLTNTLHSKSGPTLLILRRRSAPLLFSLQNNVSATKCGCEKQGPKKLSF